MVKRTYFEIVDDVDLRGRWFLNGLFDRSGTRFDSREFRYGIRVETGPPFNIGLYAEEKSVEVELPLRISLRREGNPIDFTFADFDVPVVTSNVATILASVAGENIQRVPVVVESRKEEYEIVNVISRVECIDKIASEIQWFEEGNDVRPDLAGKPEMITKLVIDSSQAEGYHMFRPKGWEVVVIVSDLVKDALEAACGSGIKFRAV